VSRALAGVALAGLLPFALLAVWARAHPVAEWELELVTALALGEGPYASLVRAINNLGDVWLWMPAVAVLAIAALVLRLLLAAALIGLTLVADIVGFAVKLIVERGRPEGALVEHFLGGDSFAFPSGHALRATALAGVLLWLLLPPPMRLPVAVGGALLAGAVMGYARVALGVHWPTDIIGGVLLGVAWFGLTAWAAELNATGRSEPRSLARRPASRRGS
jgi:membrane-associated phospholipid phosphatase